MALFAPADLRSPFRQGWWFAHFAIPDDSVRSSGGHTGEALTPAARAAMQDFEAFFVRYDRAIAGFLWRMIADDQIVCELSQETFLRAWRNFAAISQYDNPGAWLFRVATNLALQHLQRHTPARTAVSLDLVDDPASSDPTQRFVEHDQVRETLLALSPKLRAVLVLREVYGLTCDEAAQALGISYDAAKMAFWRARDQFRAIYLRKDEPR